MTWTRAAVIAALQDFEREHGRGPTAGELGFGPWRAQRVAALPHYRILSRRFGSRAAAFEAAGLPAPRSGRPGSRDQEVTR